MFYSQLAMDYISPWKVPEAVKIKNKNVLGIMQLELNRFRKTDIFK